jgi:hypothetical protein
MASPSKPHKPSLVNDLVAAALKLWDKSPLPWYRLPTWTILPLIYLLLRRTLLNARNLVEVPQPKDTTLGKRLTATDVRVSFLVSAAA